MDRIDARKRAMGIMARIQAATARHDPSYKLKKRGMLNAHDMKRLIPTLEELMDGVKIDFVWGKDPILYGLDRSLAGEKRVREALSVINSTEINTHMRG